MADTVVVIVLEGGLVQSICCSAPLTGLRFEIIDYDIEGADDDEVSSVPYVDGTEGRAHRREEALTFPSDLDWVRFSEAT